MRDDILKTIREILALSRSLAAAISSLGENRTWLYHGAAVSPMEPAIVRPLTDYRYQDDRTPEERAFSGSKSGPATERYPGVCAVTPGIAKRAAELQLRVPTGQAGLPLQSTAVPVLV